MAITKEHIRFFIHFAFHLKKNVIEANAMTFAAHGENAISHTVKDDIKNFAKELLFEDEPRAGRP